MKQRIMGKMGCNMRRIEEKCNKDSVKLKFVKRDLSKENDQSDDQDDDQYQELLPKIPSGSLVYDPPKSKTYLLVESMNYHDYTKAVISIQELLINVYEDYKRYCDKLNKRPVWGGQIRKIESIKGDRKAVTRIINS